MSKSLDLSPDHAVTLRELIKPDCVVPLLRSKTQKQCLQDLSDTAAKIAGLDPHHVFEALLQRERLGSTAIGRGVAIPHARMASVESISVVFARLEQPIEFDAADEVPVDLIVLLVSPEHAAGDHLKTLARVSRLMRDPAITARLRSTRDRNTLYSILTEPLSLDAA